MSYLDRLLWLIGLCSVAFSSLVAAWLLFVGFVHSVFHRESEPHLRVVKG